MKKSLLKTLGVTAILALTTSSVSFSQIIFQEDFDGVGGPTAGGAGTYTFPAGWLLRNVDNSTPNAATAYVNDAWERREDFKFNVADSAMFGNSWYGPAGQANDWAWTPLIGPLPANAVLRWNAVSYDPLYLEAYEVRVMVAPTTPTGGTGTIGNQITNSTVIFSTTTSPAAWTAQSAPLNAYAGQSIYIGFRNTSNDMFIQLIDDITVEVMLNYDAEVRNQTLPTEYTMIPKRQTQPLVFAADIRNNGSQAMTNVRLNVEVRNSANAVVHTASSAAVTVNAAAQSAFTIPSWTPPANADVYTIKLFSTSTEVDQQNANDTLTRTVVISEEPYARNTNVVNGALGIGAGNGGYLGQDFLVVNTGRVDSIGMYVTEGYTGRRMGIAIWNMAAGIPNQIIATTDTLLYPSTAAAYYTLPMHGGPVTLAPGRYAVTAIEFDSTLALGLTDEIFTLGRTWVDWPTNPQPSWANNEAFGANFRKSYVLNPHFIDVCPASLIDSVATLVSDAGCGLSDGSISIAVSPAGNYTYQWNSGQNTAGITGLAPGTYTVTVTNTDLVCTQTRTYTINNVNGPTLTSINATDAQCHGGNGTATIQVSGGTPGYTYQWTNGGGTSATINAVAGTYSVVVTDANGCVLNAGPVTIAEPTDITATATATSETCSGCNDGTATVNASGGTAPYTYAWSPAGGTGATANGLAPGTYTVTVTDNNGCTQTATVTVAAASGLAETEDSDKLNVFPNPSNGQFYVTSDINYSGEVVLEVMDMNGKVISVSNHVINNSFSNTSVHITNVAPGNYLLRFTAGEQVFMRKLVIK